METMKEKSREAARRAAQARSEVEELITDSGRPIGTAAEVADFIVSYPNSIRLILDRAEDPLAVKLRELADRMAGPTGGFF